MLLLSVLFLAGAFQFMHISIAAFGSDKHAKVCPFF
jgi:hypothetical protein